MADNDSEQKAALGIIWALVGGIVVAMLALSGYFGLISGKGAHPTVAAVSATQSVEMQAAAGPSVVPAAAKIFFEMGKSEVPASAAGEVATIVRYLTAHPAATVSISGYHDATGNADVNAEVSKDRAKAVRALLVAAGIEEVRVILDKPQVTLGGNEADGRRVEVAVHQ